MKNKKLFFIIFPVLLAIILFAIVTAIVSLCTSNPQGFIKFMGSFPAILFFAVIPTLVLVLYLIFFVFKVKEQPSQQTVVYQAASDANAPKTFDFTPKVLSPKQKKQNPLLNIKRSPAPGITAALKCPKTFRWKNIFPNFTKKKARV